MAKSQNDEIPEPERTVAVEKAHLLHEQLEYSRENAEDPDNEVDAAYQNRRVELTEEYIETIEGDGLVESEVREAFEQAAEAVGNTEEETPVSVLAFADRDAANQVLRRYFGDTPDVVEVGDAMNITGYEDGTVAFEGPGGKAYVQFSDEANARAAADCILDCAGVEDEAATVGLR